jgi:CheY-like chemotaxis protein
MLKGAVDFINKPVAFEQLNTIFEKIEFILSKKENKVLIIEENYKHAKALAYYLGTYNVHTEINQSVDDSVNSLQKKEVDCVILDINMADKNTNALLENIRQHEGLEDLPIILFTGKNLSQPEEFQIKKYADAIVLKTANSYQRILDEVSLFLHLVQDQQNKPAGANFERSILQENVLREKKVLLADDDVRNIYSMTKALEKYRMNVIPAMDGKEALQLVKTHNVDVILMDMMMPEMDGYESIRAIRKIPVYKNIPIIAVTAKAMSGDREKCIAAGASDYISKPVDTDQLVSLLRIWLYEKGY